MIYRITIRIEDDDDQYEVTLHGVCGDSETRSELMGAATVATERIIRALPETESFRRVG